MSSTRSARALGTALLALLVLVAGCGGVPLLDGGGTTTTGTDDPTTTATTATTDDGGTATASGEGTLVEPPLDPGALRAAHRQHLREAGSVTVRSNVTVHRPERTTTQWTVARLDLGAGTALVRSQPLSGARRSTYLAANGSAYERQVLSTGKERLFGPETALAPNRTELLDARALTFARNLSLTYEGEATLRGASGHVYVASGLDAIEVANETRLNRSRITDLEYELVLAEPGYVAYSRLNVTYDRSAGPATVVQTVRYEGIGGTTVERPDWLGEAVARARQPGPNDQVTRNYSVETADGRVVQAITAKKSDHYDGPGVGPQVSGNPIFYNEVLNASRVGPVVRLYWPESTTEVTATVHYESVPENASEGDLLVAVSGEGNQRLVPLNETATVSVDPEADTVSVTLTDPERIERLQGRTFLAMDFDLFVRLAFGDR